MAKYIALREKETTYGFATGKTSTMYMNIEAIESVCSDPGDASTAYVYSAGECFQVKNNPGDIMKTIEEATLSIGGTTIVYKVPEPQKEIEKNEEKIER